MREILVSIGTAVAWCGPHRILLCCPYQTNCCGVLSTGKQAHTLNSLRVQEGAVAWCGQHRILLCRPYKIICCGVLFTEKQAHSMNSLVIQ